MSKRAYNFNAGPAALPLAVLERAQAEFVDFKGTGMSIMEMSHRGKVYEEVHNEASSRLLNLLGNPEGYKVLFLQGGATTQFAMLPMNLLTEGKTAGYVKTGSWANKALKEAKLIGDTFVAASSEEDKYMSVPDLSKLNLPENAAYLHVTSNETIEGTQFQSFPDTGSVPLIADMSSDILCRPFDLTQFGVVYAGAQKNLGPSGVTVVIAREELLQNSPKHLPSYFRYDTHAENNSLYNTPPSFSIYMVNEVLKWIEEQGSLAGIEQKNKDKANLLYQAIDGSGGFYRGCANAADRSIMNVTFRLASEELEKQFIKQSELEGFVGLKGHRSVGGLRASIYNAVPYDSVKALVDFMTEFQKANG
ncbi:MULTISPECIES: 3-phosphoserine/phosphohydroxythreonine transaminase [Paenibacillus]|uniref:Phosphoserine aminotransferase n=1 Tax=Paenibacillus vini TaxID=1476024 RepID=A0ABQ4MGT3_9BACL|nr:MULTISPECIES: 3-phosphoserine/phosphohydroxythreonine transaminase [Paenibacillus]MBQ4901556.1 3-phosphoserine/phosphohydroxythreonine transaminase [Paenibacillus sp. Marseille-P2973]MDN4069528.1 3-phosphoserine/phosphohydroxythreonine transaminase [Paenibacillus vini]GIP55162.1 phosphoserine aminotransferase [Paenibacillus vini]